MYKSTDSLADFDPELTFAERPKSEKAEYVKIRPFNPPPAVTSLERRFDTLVKQLAGMPSHFNETNPIPQVPEFIATRSELVDVTLAAMPEHAFLTGLLETPVGHTKEISYLIASMRHQLGADPRVGFVDYKGLGASLTSTMTCKFPIEISNHSDLVRNRNLLKVGGFWDENYEPIGSMENPVNLAYLYHWAPRKNVAKILEEGLKPGFLSGSNGKLGNYVWTAYQEESSWNRVLKRSDWDDPDYWQLLKIRHVPREQTTYIHLPGSHQNDFLYDDYPSEIIIANDAIPLETIVTMQRNRDLKYIKLQAHRRKEELEKSVELVRDATVPLEELYDMADLKGISLWKYLDFYKTWVPPEFYTSLSDIPWRHAAASHASTRTEVRLDYVGPEFIEAQA